MDHGRERHRQFGTTGGSPARTLLVRCWFERGRDGATLRGTVSELSGAELGAFETIAGLSRLLRAIFSPHDRC